MTCLDSLAGNSWRAGSFISCAGAKHLPTAHIDTTRTSKPELRERFTEAIDKILENCPTDSATARWDFIRDAIHQAASDTFGKRARKNEDWFEAGIEEMEHALAAKGAAPLKYKSKPCEKNPGSLQRGSQQRQEGRP